MWIINFFPLCNKSNNFSPTRAKSKFFPRFALEIIVFFLPFVLVNMGQIVNKLFWFPSHQKHFTLFNVNQNHFIFFTENQNHFILFTENQNHLDVKWAACNEDSRCFQGNYYINLFQSIILNLVHYYL